MPSSKTSSKKYFRKKKKDNSNKKVGTVVSVEKAILETLKYRSIFDYPMSFYQLSTFLISKKKVSQESFNIALENLEKANKIKSKDSKYSLVKQQVVPWGQRYKNSVRLMQRAKYASKILSQIPWIKFIGVTGSVAAFNATKNDDIDFFIVTKAKRAWLTRGFVFLILRVLGLLRTDNSPNRKICPNIFVDETNLAWKKSARNIYVAHEVVMLHPVLDRENTYFKFLQENNWAFEYFGNMKLPENNFKKIKINKNPVINLVEEWAYQSQLNYMKSKKTKEITERNIIHFNKVDNTDNVLSKFNKS